MGKNHYAPHPLPPLSNHPFAAAEDAWFWYCKSQIARREGARFSTIPGRLAKPCDPDDIYCALDRLYRAGKLRRGHLIVLADYGLKLTPPDARAGAERTAARLWDEALSILGDALRAKGLLA